MSRSDLTSGRSNQKLRTRQALLQAAREMLENGEEPSIESVALRANVSRATSYRYFANTDKLVFEAGLDAIWNAMDLGGLELHQTDVVERVTQLHEFLWENARENEHTYRMFLSNALKEWVDTKGKTDIRGGRRLPMIEMVLEPARTQLPYADFERLRDTLAVMLGVDALILLRDICKLDYEQAKEASRWAVQSLVQSALQNKRTG